MSSDGGKDWKTECAKMNKRFNALSDNFKTAMDALRKRKKERDQWIQHAALLEKRIKSAEEEHNIQILDRSNRQAPATSHLAARAGGAKPSPSASFASDGDFELGEKNGLPFPLATTVYTNDGRVAADVHSDNTQGEAEEGSGDKLPSLPAQPDHGGVRIKEEPSSDSPVVLSERMVGKRKHGAESPEAGPPRRVKIEPASGSSPLALDQYAFDPHESLDLGDVAQRMMTPRKRKELEDSERLREAGFAAVTTPVPLFVRPDLHPQSVQVFRGSSALTPMSVNRRVIRSGGDKPRAQPCRAGLGRGIALLAEDGALYEEDTSELVPKGSFAMAPVAKGRLDSLLNNPSPDNQSFRIRRDQHRRKEPPAAHTLPIPGRRELPFERALRETRKHEAPASPEPQATLPGSVASKRDAKEKALQVDKRLKSFIRHKPVSELRLDDFRINPDANEGHDFAFSEVIRDKDERACLPGCTDMHCCGKQFRALALSQKPDPPLTAAQRQEEQKLLEGYLGDYSYRLGAMDKEERAELWVEAKTQELANKYGKHRHRYSRMRSPPGFWDADFPSTQDMDADRAEAVKREMATIEDRHREARRPGGRWVFRDE